MFIVVAVVLLLVLPTPWGVAAFGTALALFVGEALYWDRKVRGLRSPVGAQTLIGQAAIVVSACHPDGQVRVSGETWAARCDRGADVGATVMIVGRDQLTLAVEPA